MRESPFSARTVTLLLTLGVISLLSGFAAVIFGDRVSDERSSDADSFSRSAIGHAALVELLEATGRQVVRSRGRSAQKASRGALLLLLEPPDDERIEQMCRVARRTLVVLPKWRGNEHRTKQGWLREVFELDIDGPQEVLKAAIGGGSVVRSEDALEGVVSEFSAGPTLALPQLVSADSLEPLIRRESDRAILFGHKKRDDRDVWILSDPDLLSNHGLGRGDNAALVLEMISRIANEGQPLILDETLHGFAIEPNLWNALSRFPLVLVLVQLVLAMGIFVWAGIRRFGAPAHETVGLGYGKSQLIGNTAELLLYGGHSVSLLRRYLELAERRVANAWHVPPHFDKRARRARLREIGSRRAQRPTIDEAVAAVNAAGEATSDIERGVLSAARIVADWREEMLHAIR